MGTTAEPSTSVTLLNLLRGPDQNETAWRDFHERYRPMIGRWCARWQLQVADAEDVSQQILQRVFRSIGTYDPRRGRFHLWLHQVVDNAVRDFRRRGARHPGDQGSGDSDVADKLNAMAQPESVEGLAQELGPGLSRDSEEFLAHLAKGVDPDTMRAFRWVILEGLPVAEAAVKLGLSCAATGMRIKRLKDKLPAEYESFRESKPKENRP